MPLPTRFKAQERVASGAMGEVWRVEDPNSGQVLALKRLLATEGPHQAAAEALFQREFWAMASLRHPALPPALDYLLGPDGRPCFTMAWVPGPSLQGPMPEAELRACLPPLLGALGFLHAQGLVHGDLKPEHFRRDGQGGIQLMDLGLLAPIGQATHGAAGSPAYMAPERFSGGVVDGRSDLYALGVSLFELLSGRLPFGEEGGLLALAQAHRHEAPPALREWAPECSLGLAEAVAKLLAKNPADRFPSAAALAQALGLDGEVAEPEGLLGSPLVGLGAAQGALQASLKEGGAQALLLLGPEGAGKSRLLREAQAQAQLAGWACLAVEGEGPDAAPYAALRPVLRALLASAPPEARAQAEPLLVGLLPELEAQPAPALEGASERSRLWAGVADLALASWPAQGLWVVDGADRLDAASVGLLAQLQAAGAALGWRWWLAAEGPPDGPQGGLGPLPGDRLELPPLDAAEAQNLARALLGVQALPDAVEGPLAAGGLRPGAVVAWLQQAVQARALRREAGAWVLADAEALGQPARQGGALGSAWAQLPPEALALARALAVWGPQGSLAGLLACAEGPPEATFQALAQLEQVGLVRREGATLRWAQANEAAGLLASWGPEALAQAHGRVGRWLLAQGPAGRPKAEDLFAAARHLLASEAPEDGLPWALAAADQALAWHAGGGAEALVRQALAVAPEGGEAALRLGLRLAAIARAQGRVDEALALHEGLAQRLPSLPAPEAAKATTTHGSLLQQKGRYPEAAERYAQAEALAVGAEAWGEAARAAFMAARTAYFQGQAEAAMGHLTRLKPWLGAPEAAALVAPALSFAGYVLASREPGRVGEALGWMGEALTAAEALGDPLALHEAHNNQGNLLLTLGRFAEAREAFGACEALAERMALPNERTFAALNAGIADLELGRLADAERALDQALGLARGQGRRFPEALALAHLALVALRQGRLEAAPAWLDEAVAIALALGNAYAEAIARLCRAEGLLELGRLEEAQQEAEAVLALAEASGAKEHALRAQRVVAARGAMRQDPEASARLEALAEAARREDRPDLLAAALRWHIDGLRRGGDAPAALALLPEAEAAAQRAGALALQAELAWQAGVLAPEAEAAAEALARALAKAREMGAPLPEALALQALGQGAEARALLRGLLKGLGAAGRAAYLRYPERAELLQGSLEASEEGGLPLAQLGLLAELVAEAAECPDLDGVLAASLAALVGCTGMARGFLILHEGMEPTHRVFHGMVSAEADAPSEGLAQRVAWSGQAEFVADVNADEALSARGSVQALGLRSALGLPLLAPDAEGRLEVIGVMLADSPHLVAPFGPAQWATAEALARLVSGLVVAARRHERERGARVQAEALLGVAQRLLAAPDAESRWACLAEAAMAIAQAERCVLLLGEALQPARAFGLGGRPLAPEQVDFSRSVAGWAWTQGEPLHLLDAQSDEAFSGQRSVAALGLRTAFAVPIGRGEAKRGVLYLDSQAIWEAQPGALAQLAGLGELALGLLAAEGAGA